MVCYLDGNEFLTLFLFIIASLWPASCRVHPPPIEPKERTERSGTGPANTSWRSCGRVRLCKFFFDLCLRKRAHSSVEWKIGSCPFFVLSHGWDKDWIWTLFSPFALKLKSDGQPSKPFINNHACIFLGFGYGHWARWIIELSSQNYPTGLEEHIPMDSPQDPSMPQRGITDH